jgi:hypothetical protein
MKRLNFNHLKPNKQYALTLEKKDDASPSYFIPFCPPKQTHPKWTSPCSTWSSRILREGKNRSPLDFENRKICEPCLLTLHALASNKNCHQVSPFEGNKFYYDYGGTGGLKIMNNLNYMQ